MLARTSKYIMFWKIIFKLVLFSFLAIAQLSLASGLPFWLREINFLIIFMVFFLEINPSYKTVWWFVLVGFIFGLYRSFFFSFFLLFWPAVFLFCRFFYANVLTNRSLYSFLGLTVVTTWFYYFVFNSAVYIGGLFFEEKNSLFLLHWNFWLALLLGTIANLVAVIVIFYLTNLATNRLKPVFIFRKK